MAPDSTGNYFGADILKGAAIGVGAGYWGALQQQGRDQAVMYSQVQGDLTREGREIDHTQQGVGALQSPLGVIGCRSPLVLTPSMPHKHNADRRHHIPKMSFKVQNWPAYEAGRRRRGSLTLWIEDGALEQNPFIPVHTRRR